ncbi:sodium:proton antiporter [Paenibacillus sp. GP183]|jgi:cell volume regulation protein A|uniref:cation:proton antiporter n=1 Tax=Paenibacillus sp. GP183 TaxID=1882751 RepID=UPI00089927FC|nr:sodium:proton antiporter [Paenibacillus sp. GP183]SEC45877.1 sodium/proton antiporter, CPA1 family [Paenibacillus sp. GP183]
MHSATLLLAQHYLMALFIIFFIGTLGGKLADKLGIPDVAIFILLGIVLGPSMLSVINIHIESTMNQMILVFGACFIIFHGGVITSFEILQKVWRTITLLSTLGVVLTAFIVAFAATWIFHIPFLVALLLGSILASTDPAALVPIFQKFPIRRKVAQTVITEAAFTDATGAIMTTVVFGLLFTSQTTGMFSIGFQFIQLALGGIVVGVIVGFIATFLISENDRGLLREFTPMVVVLAVLGAYLLAEQIHASGFMSVFVAGLVLGNAKSLRLTILPKEEHAVHQFIDAVSLKLRMLVFILLGSQVDFSVLKQYGLAGLAVIAIFIFVARPITVLASLLPDSKAKWTRQEVLFLFWTRETGIIAAALAGIVASSDLVEGKLVSSVVFLAILATLLLQASTTPLVARKLKLMESVSILEENPPLKAP